MAGVFSKEIRQRIMAQMMPSDRRQSVLIREAQQAFIELEQGLPDMAIKILEAKGRELGRLRHEIDDLVSSLSVDEKLNLAPSESKAHRLIKNFFKPHTG